MRIKDSLKVSANALGSRLPRSVLARFGSLLNYLYTGRWLRDRAFAPKLRVRNRNELIRTIAEQIADKEVLYLEFGVWKGEATRLWSSLLRNPASRLHGFDSFEGLPEAWDDLGARDRPLEKGHFSTAGTVPTVRDPRVKFFKGWFTETLPKYEFIPAEALVLFLDADLYSSTIFVLRTLQAHIKVGSIIYFDEFWDPQHEQKAFSEFIDATEMKFEVIGADYGSRHIAFRRIA